jgi:hypothetical protein
MATGPLLVLGAQHGRRLRPARCLDISALPPRGVRYHRTPEHFCSPSEVSRDAPDLALCIQPPQHAPEQRDLAQMLALLDEDVP